MILGSGLAKNMKLQRMACLGSGEQGGLSVVGEDILYEMFSRERSWFSSNLTEKQIKSHWPEQQGSQSP